MPCKFRGGDQVNGLVSAISAMRAPSAQPPFPLCNVVCTWSFILPVGSHGRKQLLQWGTGGWILREQISPKHRGNIEMGDERMIDGNIEMGKSNSGLGETCHHCVELRMYENEWLFGG